MGTTHTRRNSGVRGCACCSATLTPHPLVSTVVVHYDSDWLSPDAELWVERPRFGSSWTGNSNFQSFSVDPRHWESASLASVSNPSPSTPLDLGLGLILDEVETVSDFTPEVEDYLLPLLTGSVVSLTDSTEPDDLLADVEPLRFRQFINNIWHLFLLGISAVGSLILFIFISLFDPNTYLFLSSVSGFIIFLLSELFYSIYTYAGVDFITMFINLSVHSFNTVVLGKSYNAVDLITFVFWDVLSYVLKFERFDGPIFYVMGWIISLLLVGGKYYLVLVVWIFYVYRNVSAYLWFRWEFGRWLQTSWGTLLGIRRVRKRVVLRSILEHLFTPVMIRICAALGITVFLTSGALIYQLLDKTILFVEYIILPTLKLLRYVVAWWGLDDGLAHSGQILRSWLRPVITIIIKYWLVPSLIVDQSPLDGELDLPLDLASSEPLQPPVAEWCDFNLLEIVCWLVILQLVVRFGPALPRAAWAYVTSADDDQFDDDVALARVREIVTPLPARDHPLVDHVALPPTDEESDSLSSLGGDSIGGLHQLSQGTGELLDDMDFVPTIPQNGSESMVIPSLSAFSGERSVEGLTTSENEHEKSGEVMGVSDLLRDSELLSKYFSEVSSSNQAPSALMKEEGPAYNLDGVLCGCGEYGCVDAWRGGVLEAQVSIVGPVYGSDVHSLDSDLDGLTTPSDGNTFFDIPLSDRSPSEQIIYETITAAEESGYDSQSVFSDAFLPGGYPSPLLEMSEAQSFTWSQWEAQQSDDGSQMVETTEQDSDDLPSLMSVHPHVGTSESMVCGAYAYASRLEGPRAFIPLPLHASLSEAGRAVDMYLATRFLFLHGGDDYLRYREMYRQAQRYYADNELPEGSNITDMMERFAADDPPPSFSGSL